MKRLLMIAAVATCATELFATLVATNAPIITVQPANATVLAPAAATFSVTATGAVAQTYQWYLNGTIIAAATNASYTTPATVFGDNGELFKVIVSNVGGCATSATVTLTVTLAGSGTNNAAFHLVQAVKYWDPETEKIGSDTWQYYVIVPPTIFSTNYPGPGTNSFSAKATIVAYGTEGKNKWYDFADYTFSVKRLNDKGYFEIAADDLFSSFLLGKITYNETRKVVTAGSLDGNFTDAAGDEYGTCSLDLNTIFTKQAVSANGLTTITNHLEDAGYHLLAE